MCFVALPEQTYPRSYDDMGSLSTKSLLLILATIPFIHRVHSSLSSPLTDVCSSVQEVSSSTFIVEGHEIVHRMLSCLDGNVNTTQIPQDLTSPIPRKRTLLERRSAAECTTPNPECQCGTPVDDCGCTQNGPTPSPEDCNTLVASLPVISSLQGPTFIVPPNTFKSISLNTCQFGLLNMAPTNTEYCWDDMAVSGDDIKFCMSSIDFATGVCIANDERFLILLGPVS